MPAPKKQAVETKRVTLKDLATHLGLSPTTVSLVLNDSPLAQTIAPKTRERIMQGAKDLNYRPNYFARYLNERRSYLIGVLSPDLAEGYDAGVLSGIEEYLLNSDYHFFVASHQWSEDRVNRVSRMFLERGAEGVILINTHHEVSLNVPVVRIGGKIAHEPGTHVSIDNEVGVQEAMRHLYSFGHREIAVIKGHKDSSDTEARWKAIQKSAQEMGLTLRPELVVQLKRLGSQQNSGIDEGERCAEQLLSARKPFTAVVAFNDVSALGVIKKLHSIGMNVPGDVSVVGFDDVPAAQINYPALTTVRQPLRQMGETAAKEVIRAITDGPLNQKIVIEPQLIVRASTARANRKQ